MSEDIDRLISDLEKESGGRVSCDDKGLIRLIRSVIGAGSREATVRIYGMMKRSGWGSSSNGSSKADEYMVKVLSKGLRSLGEADLADEVDGEFGSSSRGNFATFYV